MVTTVVGAACFGSPAFGCFFSIPNKAVVLLLLGNGPSNRPNRDAGIRVVVVIQACATSNGDAIPYRHDTSATAAATTNKNQPQGKEEAFMMRSLSDNTITDYAAINSK